HRQRRGSISSNNGNGHGHSDDSGIGNEQPRTPRPDGAFSLQSDHDPFIRTPSRRKPGASAPTNGSTANLTEDPPATPSSKLPPARRTFSRSARSFTIAHPERQYLRHPSRSSQRDDESQPRSPTPQLSAAQPRYHPALAKPSQHEGNSAGDGDTNDINDESSDDLDEETKLLARRDALAALTGTLPSPKDIRSASTEQSATSYDRPHQARPGSSRSEQSQHTATGRDRSRHGHSRSVAAQPFVGSSLWSPSAASNTNHRRTEHRLPTIPSSLTGDTSYSELDNQQPRGHEEAQARGGQDVVQGGSSSGAIRQQPSHQTGSDEATSSSSGTNTFDSGDKQPSTSRSSTSLFRKDSTIDFQSRLGAFSQKSSRRANTTQATDVDDSGNGGNGNGGNSDLNVNKYRSQLGTSTSDGPDHDSHRQQRSLEDPRRSGVADATMPDTAFEDAPRGIAERSLDTSSKDSMAESGKSSSGKGEDPFLSIARSSSSRKIARMSMPVFPKENRNVDSPDREREKGESRVRRSPPSLHPYDEASRLRYFGRNPRSVEGSDKRGDKSPSALETRFQRSKQTGLEMSSTMPLQSHQQPSYVHQTKQGAASSLSSSTHNSRSWGSSCFTEKQQLNMQQQQQEQQQEQQQQARSEEFNDATSEVWNELDDLKSRIARLEITGKIEPTPGSQLQARERSAANRPKTATVTGTPAQSRRQSPRRSHSVQENHLDVSAGNTRVSSRIDGSVTPNTGAPNNVNVDQLHPLLHHSLEKAKQHLSSNVFRTLYETAQDALVAAALLGSTANGASSANGASNGQGISTGSAGHNERQARRKVDSVCRGLTELCLALSEELTSLSQAAAERQDANGSQSRVANDAEGWTMEASHGTPRVPGEPTAYVGGAWQGTDQFDKPGLQRTHTNRESVLLHSQAMPMSTNPALQPAAPLEQTPNGSLARTQSTVAENAFSPTQTVQDPAMSSAPLSMAPPSNRLLRLSTAFKSKRLQQDIGLDTAQEHLPQHQHMSQSPMPPSAVSSSTTAPRLRAASRVSFAQANAPVARHRLSTAASNLRDRRMSREVSQDLDYRSHQQQLQQPQQGQTTHVQPRVRSQASAFSVMQTNGTGPASSSFSFQAPFRTRTFTPQGALSASIPQQEQLQSPPQQQQSMHAGLAASPQSGAQTGLRRFGLSMLGRKSVLGTNVNGMTGSSGTGAEASTPTGTSFGARARAEQASHVRPRTRSVGNASQSLLSTSGPRGAGGLINGHGGSAGASAPQHHQQPATTVTGMRRLSMRPPLRSTHSTEA
ncbi:hypothetical protein KEM52_006431, partial [Ascosphaera acerosa]